MDEPFPAPVYAETVLAHNFDDAKKYFLEALLEIHLAHTRMLQKQGLLAPEEAAVLIHAVRVLDRTKIDAATYDGRHEDLFFYIESALEEHAGPDLAGKMHTARSRNDIAITLYRMTARRELLNHLEALARLRATLLSLASNHRETVMPAHTHTQPAQPTTLAHYLLAAIEFLARDAQRLEAAYTHVNQCPMGAAAITTTGFPIDRDETARLLGFECLAKNSYGAIASIDYITESAAALAVAMINLGKLTQDLLLWSTREFGYVRLSSGYVQSSSIMPQKRNPVALEHTRILASRALGQAQAVLTCAHNTPFGDINDSEDDLQPLVFDMFSCALRATRLLAAVLCSIEIDVNKMAAQASRDFLTVTELADTLVRRERLTFRKAHAIVAQAVRSCESESTLPQTLLRQNPNLTLSPAEITKALDPVNFVQIRTIPGGPAPSQTAHAIEEALALQREIETWIAAQTTRLAAARTELFH